MTVVGYRLPPGAKLNQLTGSGRLVAGIFVSPSCSTCHRLIDELGAWAAAFMADGGDLPVRAAVVSTGACPPLPAALDPITVCIADAADEHAALGVVATPWLLIVQPDGTVIESAPAGSTATMLELIGAHLAVPGGVDA